ncbi:hypothetical protein V6Z12_D10G269100 [Gossypium hirsutum]
MALPIFVLVGQERLSHRLFSVTLFKDLTINPLVFLLYSNYF